MNARSFLFDVLHQEAYRNKGLGQPLYIPESNVHHLSFTNLRAFVDQLYTTDRVTVVACGGVEHGAFAAAVGKAFSQHKAAGKAISKPASEYFGGEFRLSGHYQTHLALGFHGVSWNDKDVYALRVLQALLGGYRASFDDELGRGAATRLGAKVSGPIVELSVFNASYSDSGLFGVFGVAKPGHAAQLADSITSVIAGATRDLERDLARAIAQARASVLFGYQSRAALLEFVGTQSAAHRAVQTPEQFAQGIQSVTAADVKRVAARVFGSRPTLAALGDVVNLPTVDAVQKAIKS